MISGTNFSLEVLNFYLLPGNSLTTSVLCLLHLKMKSNFLKIYNFYWTLISVTIHVRQWWYMLKDQDHTVSFENKILIRDNSSKLILYLGFFSLHQLGWWKCGSGTSHISCSHGFGYSFISGTYFACSFFLRYVFGQF